MLCKNLLSVKMPGKNSVSLKIIALNPPEIVNNWLLIQCHMFYPTTGKSQLHGTFCHHAKRSNLLQVKNRLLCGADSALDS